MDYGSHTLTCGRRQIKSPHIEQLYTSAKHNLLLMGKIYNIISGDLNEKNNGCGR